MNDNARAASDTLLEIAETTGGIAFHNSNDIFAGLQLAFADGRQYYVLAYASSNSNLDGTFRAISVRVGNSKLSVRAKVAIGRRKIQAADRQGALAVGVKLVLCSSSNRRTE